MKHLEDRLAVEPKADAKLALVFVESSLAPAGEDRAVVDTAAVLDATLSTATSRTWRSSGSAPPWAIGTYLVRILTNMNPSLGRGVEKPRTRACVSLL